MPLNKVSEGEERGAGGKARRRAGDGGPVKVCIIDDVVSTGESLSALEELVRAAGADIVRKVCVLAEGDAAKRDDLIFLERLPLFRKVGENDYEEID